jgi:hypothetical protein
MFQSLLTLLDEQGMLSLSTADRASMQIPNVEPITRVPECCPSDGAH